MRTLFLSRSQQVLGVSAATVLTLLLSGCGIGNAGGSSSGVAPVVAEDPGTISGGVHGGQQPVTGATIQLYEVGSTGYTSGKAKPLIASTNQSGGVNSVTISSGGSGYTSNFPVSFSGGGSGASGAAGTAIVSGGAVTSVTITSAGTGYTASPSVSFTNGSGTGAAGTPLITGSGDALTDANGTFNITGDYTCDSGSYVYIAAYGGNPGAGSVNPNIALIAALGPCSVLKANAATTVINIDEVTTVAAAYALAQFAGGSNFGVSLSAQPGVAGTQAPADNFTTSSTNNQGIANAMAIAGVLANTSFGTSPGSNANGSATVEYWQVNNVANILSACVNSTSPYAPCTTLYSNVNPLGGTTVPADTLQAAIALAQSPVLTTGAGGQIANLYGIIPPTAPFNPYSSAYTQIHDFTLAIGYNPVVPSSATPYTLANTLVYAPMNIAFDQYGNAWIGSAYGPGTTPAGTCATSGTAACNTWLVELDPTGNPIPAGSASVGGTSNSNYWINSYSLGTTPTTGGTTTTFEGLNINSTTYTGGGTPQGIAIDTTNNVWITDTGGGNVMVVPGSGAVYTSTGTASTYNGGNAGAYGYAVGLTGTYGSGARPEGIAIDGNNDVFMTNVAGNYVSSTTGKTNTSIANTKGLITFIGGNAGFVSGTQTNVDTTSVSGGQYIVAIDGGTQAGATATDTVSVNGTATTIPGAPFVWTSTEGNAWIEQAYTSTGTGANQGWVTPLSSGTPSTGAAPTGIGGANAGTMETTIPYTSGTLFPAVSGDSLDEVIATSNEYGFTTDGYGNIWVSSLSNYVDSASSVRNVLTKIIPNYGTSTTTAQAGFTSANAAANFTFVEYHDLGGLTSGTGNIQARFITSDGAGNIWFALNSGFIGGITNSGTALSPSYTTTPGGFQGASVPTGAVFTGTSTTYARTATVKQPQVDLSGNIWVPEQHAAWPNLTVLVGLGAPTAATNSSALAAGKYGRMP